MVIGKGMTHMLKLDMHELRFCLLEGIFNTEPFSILVQYVDSENMAEVERFIDTMCTLVAEGALSVEYGQAPIRVDAPLRELLGAYVTRRVELGEHLSNWPEVCDEYEFTLTEKGSDWLLEQYSAAEEMGRQVVEMLEAYRREKGVYPKTLFDLASTSRQAVREPDSVCGCWWYRSGADGLSYRLGYVTYVGWSFFYDPATNTWLAET